MSAAADLLSALNSRGVRLWSENGKLRYRAPKGVVDEALLAELKRHKQSVLELIDLEDRIPRAPNQPDYELSHAQRRLWVLCELEEDSAAYNVPLHQRIDGPLDVDALRRAFDQIAARHESLRTTFTTIDGEPRQRIHPPAPAPFTVEPQPEGGWPAALDRARKHSAQRFRLTEGPLWSVTLLPVAEQEHLLMVTLHHIICDGVSVATLGAEVNAFYNGRTDLPPLRIQYRDYAVWQRRMLQSPIAQEHRDYWHPKLAAPHPILDLPADRPRPPAQSFAGDEISFTLAPDKLARLQALARAHNASLFAVLVALVKTQLHRLTSKRDIIIGSPFAGHTHPDLQGQIGFYINMLPLRDTVEPTDTFAQLLARVRRTVTEAFDHQAYPFDRLVDEVGVLRDRARAPLFDVLLILQSQKDEGLQLGGLQARSCFEHSATSKFDLTYCFKETADGLIGSIEYATALFDADRIHRLIAQLETLAESVCAAPNHSIGRLWGLPPSERVQVTSQQGPALAPISATALDLITAQAQNTPDKTAVIEAAAEGRSLTYAQLLSRADRIAAQLISLGVQPEDRVGVLLDRTADLPAALLGVWRAGAAYLPLDRAFPADRLRLMIEDAAPTAVIAQPEHAAAVGIADIPVLNTETLTEAAPPLPPCSPESLAYVIYTSGSTGRPKGVEIPHRALVNFLRAMEQSPGLTAADTLLAVTTLSFDIAALELFLPLITGATIALADRETAADPDLLLAAVARCRATVLQATPATWKLLLTAGWTESQPLRAWCGGEALQRDLARQILERAPELWNLYGPTETTIWSAAARVTADEREDPVPVIGPIAETQLYVLDAQRELAPLGVPGELFIAGEGLARGYHGDPRRTALAFLPNPFSAQPGSRMYATGDLVRLNADGRFSFLGRIDNQVKIRGFRIELGDIEATLTEHPAVREAVVIARQQPGSEPALHAYLVGDTVSDEDIRNWLGQRLPAYMTPQAFVRLDRWPLTPNGKINRRVLPAPDAPAEAPAAQQPTTDTERKIAAIWAELLNRQDLPIDRGFFELGGHSLLAMQATARIRERFQIDLALGAFFESPTIRDLAITVETRRRSARPRVLPSTDSTPAPLATAQRRIWFHQQRDGGAAYNLSAVLCLQGALDAERLAAALATLTKRHQILRTVFPQQGGEPVQQLTSRLAALERHDTPDAKADALAEAHAFADRPFDLAAEPPLRAALWAIRPGEHILSLSLHHIAGDEWSIGVLLRELNALYQDRPLPDLAVQYADYARWERTWLSDQRLEQSLDFWRSTLSDANAALEIPADFVGTAPVGPTAKLRFNVPAATADSFQALAEQRQATGFMAYLAAYALTLSRHAAQDALTIGAPTANRDQPELDALIGCFVNTLALPVTVNADRSFNELLAAVRSVTLRAFDHKETPLEAVTESLNRQGPLFRAVLNLQAATTETLTLGQTVVELLPASDPTSKFDLSLTLSPSSSGLSGELEYRADLWSESTIQQIADTFINVLAAASAQPETPLGRLPLAAAIEQPSTPPPNQTVAQAFATQAARTSGSVALDLSDAQITYRDLDQFTNQLARTLLDRGAAPEKCIAILVEQGADAATAALAVAKTGAAYTVVTPDQPPARIALALEDAQVSLAITRKPWLQLLPPAVQAIRLDADESSIGGQSDAPVACPAAPQNLGLVVFTSGSTGRPKGVAIDQAAVTRLAFDGRVLALGPGVRVGQASNLAFDAFSFELWQPLLNGATVVPIDRATKLDPAKLAAFIRDRRLNALFLTTALFNQFVEAQPDALAALDAVLFGGEAADPDTLRRLLTGNPPKQVLHLYGPSESTTFAAIQRLQALHPNARSVPIGGPVSGATLHVFDRHGALAPHGAPGELAIGGDRLARNYLNDPKTTADRFRPDPYAANPGARLYLTGDRVRRDASGSLHFLGRADDQIKIRGFRVEPNEIAAVLAGHPAVAQAHVAVKTGPDGMKSLAAYVALNDDTPAANLQAFLRDRLPDYMTPAAFALLDRLPLNANGKVDRQALAAVQFETPSRNRVAPRTSAERVVAALYEKLLHADQVGADDNFFELGGHSLLATQVLSRLHAVFGVDLPINEFFRQSSPAAVARLLEQREPTPGRTAKVAEAYERVSKLSPEERQRLLAQKRDAAAR